MHSSDVRQAALDLFAQGFNDCDVSRRLGVPRRTVRDWRLPSYEPRNGLRPKAVCFRCWQPTSPVLFTPTDYAELLGLYLGDGHITQMARVQRLRLMLDAKYAVVVDEAADLISRIVPWNKVGRQFPHEGRMVTLHAYHRHWTCLFPQHGPGKKHDRPIALEAWQETLVAHAPWAFLRGCIRSDGCIFINRTGSTSTSRTTSPTSPPESLSYSSQLAQASASSAPSTPNTCGSIGGPACRSCRARREKALTATRNARLGRSLRLW